MRKGIVIGVTVAAGFALVAGLAMAGGQRMLHGIHGGHGKAVAWIVNGALDEIKATDAQRAKVLAVKDRMLAQVEKLHASHEATHAEIERQWAADKMDAAALHALVNSRIDELRGVLNQGVDSLIEVHDTLTPEQRTQLADLIEEWHGIR